MSTTLNEDAAAYILHLERMVLAGQITQREALERAFSLGTTRGKIDGLDIAKEIFRAAKP